MNYCRQCHSYYTNAETCACPAPEGAVPEGGALPGERGRTDAGSRTNGPRAPYPAAGDAVRTGLFD